MLQGPLFILIIPWNWWQPAKKRVFFASKLMIIIISKYIFQNLRISKITIDIIGNSLRSWLIKVKIIMVTAQTPDQTNKTNMWLSFIRLYLSIYNRLLLLLNERGRQERGRQARAQLSTVWYPQRPRLIKVEIIIVMKISGCYGTFLNGLSF